MFMILIASMLAPSAPAPKEIVPRILIAYFDDDKLISEATTTINVQVPVVRLVNGITVTTLENIQQRVTNLESWDLKGATFSTVGSEKLDLEAVKKRLTTKAKVVFLVNGISADPSYLKGLDKNVIVIGGLGEPKKIPAPPTPVDLNSIKPPNGQP